MRRQSQLLRLRVCCVSHRRSYDSRLTFVFLSTGAQAIECASCCSTNRPVRVIPQTLRGFCRSTRIAHDIQSASNTLHSAKVIISCVFVMYARTRRYIDHVMPDTQRCIDWLGCSIHHQIFHSPQWARRIRKYANIQLEFTPILYQHILSFCPL